MESNSGDIVRCTRRLFLKKSLRTGGMLALSPFILSILNCAHDPYKQKPEEFTIENFDRWYKRNRLYNGVNPNLKSPHSNGKTGIFKANTFSSHGATPGIDYNVPRSEVMVASAPGKVIDIQELHTGRAGGAMVTLAHPYSAEFKSYYAHLHKVFVNLFQYVKRGDPIGNVTEHREYAKLMLKENSWVDPDNYGPNHGYMKYNIDMDSTFKDMPVEVTKAPKLKISDSYNMDFNTKEPSISTIKKKKYKQRDIYYQLFESFESDNKFLPKWHKKSGSKACGWSTVEKFKYLSTLYDVKPDLFPDLPNEKLQSMKKEFYDNQPIVLTLPFKKGGMKKY